jgi:hypothetical protein
MQTMKYVKKEHLIWIKFGLITSGLSKEAGRLESSVDAPEREEEGNKDFLY